MAGAELHIGLPNVPEGPDMDLDSPLRRGPGMRSDSPSKKAKGAPPEARPAAGGGGDMPTMDGLRFLLQEQSKSLLQAQQSQLSQALAAFEDRQSARLEKIETRVDDATGQVEAIQKQVKDLTDRLAKVESQPGGSASGPDRRHTLVFGGWHEGTRKSVLLYQLQQAISGLNLAKDLDQEPFCTGAHRSVSLCTFRRRTGEDEGLLRDRMLHVLQTVNASKVTLDEAARPLWCSFSKSPAERGKASLAAAVRKVVLRFAPTRVSDLDVEYTTGNSWIKADQLSGMSDQFPPVRGARQVSTRGGEGWIDEKTLAKWVDTELAEVRGVLDEHRF